MSEARSVLGVICSFYDSFFEAEKKIADYIMEHKAQAVDMTVGELARASGTSDATVSRFCRRCGFKGFQSLKLALAREVLREEQDSRKVTNDIDRENLSQSLNNILANKVAELTETVRMMDIHSLEEILKKLEKARMVQLAAVGNTIPVALDGAFKFNQLGIPSVAGDIWETQAQGAKENGSTLVLITNNPDSPLASICDHKIITATREKLLTEEFWFSRVTATAVIEILYLLLRAGKKDAMEHIRRHEEAISSDKNEI